MRRMAPLAQSELPNFVHLNQLRGEPLELGMFERLSPAERSLLEVTGRRLILKSGHMLFRQGTRHGGIYIIESGRVRTFYLSSGGREFTIAYWPPGNFVGGPELFGRGQHCWSGITTEPTQVIYLSGDQLCEILAVMPLFTMALLDGLVLKGRCFSGLLQMLTTKNAQARLAMALLEFADYFGVTHENGIHVEIPYTHGEIAALIGVSRQWVTTCLGKFRDSGAIRIEGKVLIIPNPDRLRRLSGWRPCSGDA